METTKTNRFELQAKLDGNWEHVEWFETAAAAEQGRQEAVAFFASVNCQRDVRCRKAASKS